MVSVWLCRPWPWCQIPWRFIQRSDGLLYWSFNTHLTSTARILEITSAILNDVIWSRQAIWNRQWQKWLSGQCASYQIREIAGYTCAGNAGNVFPATDFKGNRYLASPACITTRASRDACRGREPAVAGKTFSSFLAHAQPAILRIW